MKINAQIKELAFARSGDKGDISNIGLLAKNDECYEIMKKEITSERIRNHFGKMVKGEVNIYEMPNTNALQIVMHNALGGGATKTLRYDQTGKSMGQALLKMSVPVEKDAFARAKKAEEDIYKKYSDPDWGSKL